MKENNIICEVKIPAEVSIRLHRELYESAKKQLDALEERRRKGIEYAMNHHHLIREYEFD